MVYGLNIWIGLGLDLGRSSKNCLEFCEPALAACGQMGDLILSNQIHVNLEDKLSSAKLSS